MLKMVLETPLVRGVSTWSTSSCNLFDGLGSVELVINEPGVGIAAGTSESVLFAAGRALTPSPRMTFSNSRNSCGNCTALEQHKRAILCICDVA